MEERISYQDLWKFVQAHKDKTKDEFGSWCLGQTYRPTDKIAKAVQAWNRQHGADV